MERVTLLESFKACVNEDYSGRFRQLQPTRSQHPSCPK